MKTLGIIGYGNMGKAIMDALMQVDEYNFAVSDTNDEKLQNLLLSGQKITISLDAQEIIDISDIVITDNIISFLGSIDSEGINLNGKILSPGFVDIHTHLDKVDLLSMGKLQEEPN